MGTCICTTHQHVEMSFSCLLPVRAYVSHVHRRLRSRQGIELEKEYKVTDKVKDSIKKSIDSAKN